MTSSGALAVWKPDDLLFGHAPKPVVLRRGLEIGSLQVIPEISFTAFPADGQEESWDDIASQYRGVLRALGLRAAELQAPGMLVEFEHLPAMTENPAFGACITRALRETLDDLERRYGLKCALRVSPTDLRDDGSLPSSPPRMRSGENLRKMLESFEACGRAGADLFSIESTGGKELHDPALLQASLAGIAYALGVLAVRDMGFLWGKITEIAQRTGAIPAGDSACGFANTAMMLADKGNLSKTLAAVVRTASVARSLEAHKRGAIGPTKDCAAEGPFLKALTGAPISMIGKGGAFARPGALGNIAAAYCDAWSNESIPAIRMGTISAPAAALEMLIYDCRLMNQALKESKGSALHLRHWMIQSDAPLDPQAWIFRPAFVVELAQTILDAASPLDAVLASMELTLERLREASARGELALPPAEREALDRFSREIEKLPADEQALEAQVRETIPEAAWLPGEYGIA